MGPLGLGRISEPILDEPYLKTGIVMGALFVAPIFFIKAFLKERL